MKHKKLLQRSVLAVLLLVLIVGLIKCRHTNNDLSAETVTVEAVKVKIGDIPVEVRAVATLSAAKSVQITAEIQGQVAKILFQDGSFVKQGTPLIQLDDKVAKSKAESSKAALYFSETNYKRMVLLGKQGAVSRQAIDSALAELKQKQADAQESEVMLEKTYIVAPFDGVLSKAKVNPGDHVTVGQSLVVLTDIQHLRVEYSVPESLLPDLKLGQDVKISTSTYPDKTFTGKVTYISPTINTENRTIDVYAEIPNDDKLLTAGLFVNAIQFLKMQSHAMLVPPDSIVPTIDGQRIFKIIDSKAISVPVTLGQRTAENVQITQGLNENDTVVIAGQEKLKDDMPVKIQI